MRNTPYIWTSGETVAAFETGEGDDYGPVLRQQVGHRALWAAELPPDAWCNWAEWLRFVAILPQLAKEGGCVGIRQSADGCMLIGAAWGANPEEAENMALAQWEAVAILAPPALDLTPIADEATFERLGLTAERTVAEIRRYEALVGDDSPLYLPLPFQTHERLWAEVVRMLPPDTALLITLHPLRPTVYEIESIGAHLAAFTALAESAPLHIRHWARIGAATYAGLSRNLAHVVGVAGFHHGQRAAP